MKTPVMIIGATPVGKAAMEFFQKNKIIVYGFLDDNEALHGTTIGEVSVLGSTSDKQYLGIIGENCNAFVALEDTISRQSLIEELKTKNKVQVVSAIDNENKIAESVWLGHGLFISSGVTIGAFAKISDYCTLNTGAVIDYDAVLENNVHIGAGAIIGSECEIAEGAFIGSGAVIVSGVRIGAGARVGAGSVVIGHVDADTKVFGNPAKELD